MKQTRDTLQISFTTLEQKVEKNSFALLRLLISILGKEQARLFISLISSEDHKNDDSAKLVLYNALRIRFPSLQQMSEIEIEKKLILLYEDADNIILNLIASAFEGIEFELNLLNSTTLSTSNLVKRIQYYMSNGVTTPRYKYELLRQDIIALLLLEIEENSQTHFNRALLNKLESLFESKLYLGKTGQVTPKRIISVHSQIDNQFLGSFDSVTQARKFQQKQTISTHIKEHEWKTRNIINIGPTLVRMRLKSPYSILRKAIYKGKLEKKKAKIIKIADAGTLIDRAGFMFVSENGKRTKLSNIVLQEIINEYPNATYFEKHIVGKTAQRQQSNKVNFLRYIVYLEPNVQPIEIIFMDVCHYLNYTLELDQAHELFDKRKSSAAADLLFPQEIFELSVNKVSKSRRISDKKTKRQLLQKNRLI